MMDRECGMGDMRRGDDGIVPRRVRAVLACTLRPQPGKFSPKAISITMRALLGAAAAALATPTMAAGGPLLHPMFQDHGVLQRDRPIPVYGDAAPGASITVTLAKTVATTRAARDGSWQVSLPAQPAGGPYVLEAATDTGQRQRADDVLVGDVFLCTGQSNMQLAVRAAADAQAEIRAATDGQIRQLTVATKDSLTPLRTFATPVQWAVASPDSVGNFSASCYYFARELKKTAHVPIGLVVAAWGGSRVRAWVSEQGLRRLPYMAADLDLLDTYRKDPQTAMRRWDRSWESWWRANGAGEAGGDPWQPAYASPGWATAPEALGPWALWTGSSPDGFVGQMWLRTTVTLTAAQARQPAVLDLGPVNEEDQSWINGRGVGGTSWSKQARHEIPAGVLRAGENVIVTNIFCSWRNCGLSGPAEARAIRLKDGNAVPLSGAWRYTQVPGRLIAPQLPWGPTHGASVDYNGMIAPMGRYVFRAAIWYQGESDIYFADRYRTTLTAMMADWRERFGADMPFLIVQLPDYGPRPTRPAASVWSDVREAQRLAAAADPRAGHIVTVDIGDPANLHPTNKQELGRRLAIAARHVVYSEDMPIAGPAPADVRREGDRISVRFKDITDKLVSYSGNPHGFELCGPSQATCAFADGHIEGADKVVLTPPSSGVWTRVRFCWGDSPICTLSDGSSLPATPFEAAIP